MKIKVPWNHFHDVNRMIKKSDLKFYPFKKIHTSYIMEFASDSHPVLSMILLKFDDIEILN
jgi:hypothetical protein